MSELGKLKGWPVNLDAIRHEIERGMALKKCRRCGCMNDALTAAERVFSTAEDGEVRALEPEIRAFRARMDHIAYECIGCKKCWGADASKLLTEHFGDVAFSPCETGCKPRSKVKDSATRPRSAWPPYAGDYVLGHPEGSVAICTLSNRRLGKAVVAEGEPAVAIAGRCDTENIGIEKVVLNLLANPRIRWLILCGVEAEGHRAGDAFLRLKERGVDPNLRVLESASWRPVLKNLTLLDVARFREQVELVNLVGTVDVKRIIAAARECARRPVPPLAPVEGRSGPRVERIAARAPERLKLDPAGFFIVIPDAVSGTMNCEHYENSGRLAHIIEGREAAVIAATAVEQGLVTRLDHAAYLGRELAKAELALKHGVPYEQDAALGQLPVSAEEPDAAGQSCGPGAACGCHR